MTTVPAHRYKRENLKDRPWHRYVIHKLRHGDQTGQLISKAQAWAIDNLNVGEWMIYIVDRDASAIVYVGDDQAALLFELALQLHPGDKRGKHLWA